MTTKEADVPVIEPKKGTHGEYYFISSLKLLDEDPRLLATRCPVWLVDEKERLKAMTPAQLRHEWTRRVKALDEYRERKAADPGVTVDA